MRKVPRSSAIRCVLALLSMSCAQRSHPTSPTTRVTPVVVDVPKQYAHSFATLGCSPIDNPILVLYLLDSRETTIPPTREHLRVEVWPPLTTASDLSHQTFEVTASSAWGRATLCSSPNSCETATAGRITFGEAKAGRSYEGELDVSFARGGHVRTTFNAAWRSRRPALVCG